MPDDPQLDALKLPPHSLEAEQSILGGLLLDNEAADRIGDVVAEDDFYSDAHRLIYRHVSQLGGEGKPVDVVTLSESLASVQKLDYVGGLAYLGALVQNVPTAANIRHYANIVRERSILRQLAATAGEIADTAYNPLGRKRARPCSTRPRPRSCTSRSRARAAQQNFQRLGTLLTGVVDRIETLYNRDDPSDVTGVATGYTDLDRMTSGLQAGDLVVVAGRPSMGKTALALNIGEHVALEPEAARRRLLDGNGRVAARAADDRLGGQARPAQAAHRAPGPGRLGEAVERARPLERSADADRRDAGAQRHRGALARAAPGRSNTASWAS